jgi:hexosaminidase
MSHHVIPAPAQFDSTGGRFVLRPGTAIGYAAPAAAALVERFCSEVARRTGLRLAPLAGNAGAGEPAVRIELVAGDELGVLPAPLGISPADGGPPDERHSLAIDAGEVVLRAVEPAGVARGLTTLVQLLAAAPDSIPGEAWLPAGRILDAPRYAWRGLSIDLARAFFTLDEVRRVIDLLALYKLNVLHVHLTDDQSWRLPIGWPGQGAPPGAACYRAGDLRALAAYAADRFVTVVPEVDTPGHTSALVDMRPELNTGRNTAGFELPPGHLHPAVWLDPELPATFQVVRDVLAGVADIFPSPYLHIGGDEPRGMPHDLYAAYVRRVRDVVRAIGRRPLGWQESARAGLGADDIIQYWLTDIALPASLPPEVRAQMDEDLALSRRDVRAAAAASVPVIVSPLSHCYLDVPYAEPSADPAQADRQGRTGLRVYSPMTVEESFGWDPAEVLGPGRAAQVAGVEAAIWAETITGFDDLSFLLLPRLPGVAHKAWSGAQPATWADHRDRLARHGRLWAQDGLTYFRTSTVDWL